MIRATESSRKIPAEQTENARKLKARRERYRREVIDQPEGNTGLPGFEEALSQRQGRD